MFLSFSRRSRLQIAGQQDEETVVHSSHNLVSLMKKFCALPCNRVRRGLPVNQAWPQSSDSTYLLPSWSLLLWRSVWEEGGVWGHYMTLFRTWWCIWHYFILDDSWFYCRLLAEIQAWCLNNWAIGQSVWTGAYVWSQKAPVGIVTGSRATVLPTSPWAHSRLW